MCTDLHFLVFTNLSGVKTTVFLGTLRFNFEINLKSAVVLGRFVCLYGVHPLEKYVLKRFSFL